MASYTPKSLTLEKNGDSFIYNFDDKVDKNQGVENAGKALGINAQGQVQPVEFSGEDFTGATASTAGVHGYVPAPSAGDQDKVLYGDGTWKTPAAEVSDMIGATSSSAGVHGLAPAPAAGDQNKVLTGGGTWEESPGARVYVVTCTVTNASGAYEHTFEDDTVTASMKGVEIEVPNPYVFGAPILVTPGDGEYTVSCSDVCGTDTIKISFIKVVDDPYAIHSSEFDLLNNRLTAIENVYHDEHLTIHPLDWTLSGGVYTYTWLSNKVTAKTCVEAWAEDGSEESGLETFDYEKVSGGVQITADALATGDLPVTIRVMAVKAQDVVAIQGTDVATSVISGAANVDEALEALNSNLTKTTLSYNNYVDLGSTVYTLPSDGYIEMVAAANAYVYAYYNNEQSYLWHVSRLNGAVDSKVVFYAKKGMKLRFHLSSNDCRVRFFPFS